MRGIPWVFAGVVLLCSEAAAHHGYDDFSGRGAYPWRVCWRKSATPTPRHAEDSRR